MKVSSTKIFLALTLSVTPILSSATCWNDLQSVPPGKNAALETDSIQPIKSEGRIAGISIHGQTFTIKRDSNDKVIGVVDSSGAVQTLSENSAISSIRNGQKSLDNGSPDWSGDPCYSIGSSIDFDIFNYAENRLEFVTIVGESVKRVESWFPIMQKPFPSDQELQSNYGSKDQIQECRGRLYACLDGLAGIDSTNLGTCVSAAAIAAQKGLWSAAVVFAACVAGKDEALKQKTNACWAAYATCSLQP